MFWFFGQEARGIEPAPPASEGELNQWTTREMPLNSFF